MVSHELTVSEQRDEIRKESLQESESFKLAHAKIDRQISLDYINMLLDEYLKLETGTSI